MLILLLSLSLFRVPAIAASPQDFSGRWELAIEGASKRMDNGGSMSRTAMSGVLMIDVDEENVRGTFSHDLPGGEAMPVTGVLKGGRLHLVTSWREVKDQSRIFRTRWVLDAGRKEDGLAGTCRLELEGRAEWLEQRWTARRPRLRQAGLR